jgi:hypothetical protein
MVLLWIVRISILFGLCLPTRFTDVLQFTLVDAFGKKVIANAHRNSDLFWCLRGGGGGTFGVVTEVVHKTRQYDSRVLFVSHNLRKIPDIITSWRQLSLSLLQIQQSWQVF